MTVLEPVLDWLNNCGLKTVDLAQVMEGADRPRKPVLRVMDKLVREGYAEEVSSNKIPLKYGEFGPARRNPSWMLLDKPLTERPTRRPKRKSLRDKLWASIRRKRIFTRKDLMRTTGVSLGSVELYTKQLEKAGYLRVEGKDVNQKVYKLVRGRHDFNRPLLKEKENE